MDARTIYEDGTYLAHNPTWHEEDSPWKAKQISTMLRKNKMNPRTVCEIGCGAGGILSCLAAEAEPTTQFVGYEISPQAFEICKGKQRQNLHFCLGDLLDEKDASFDVVLAIDVFEHVEDYIGFLRRLKTKGRYKIFHIPLELSVQTVLRSTPILKSRAGLGHLHCFSKETALASLQGAGYEIVDYFYTKSAVERTGPSWKRRLMRIPRKLFFPIHQDMAVRILGGYSLLVLTT